jgi:hypothetical protein
MSYSEARNHFEKAKLDNLNKGMVDLLDGLKHLSHALEEDFRTLEQSVRNIPDAQSSPTRNTSSTDRRGPDRSSAFPRKNS